MREVNTDTMSSAMDPLWLVALLLTELGIGQYRVSWTDNNMHPKGPSETQNITSIAIFEET